MGVELHITRAPLWCENETAQITAEEWLAYVSKDPELRPWPENGPYFARWLGASAYEEPWLDWSQGNISTKWPDTALFQKMLSVAAALGAHVQDDDGETYSSPTDWQFDPRTVPVAPQKRPWWRFW
jgi:hypothetical protein